MRASKLDLALACPASQIAVVGPRVERDDAGARTGSATHEVMALTVRGQPVNVREVAERWHVDPKEVSMLRACARQLWDKYGPAFPDPVCETELSESQFYDFTPGELGLTGHPDVMACVDGEVRIGDWKTGITEGAHVHQLRAYAFLGIQYYRSIGVPADRAYVAQFRVRTREIIPAMHTADELMRWYRGAVNRLQVESVYRPAPENCQYCPRRLECPARRTMLREGAAVLTEFDGEGPMSLENLTDDHLRRGVAMARVLQSLLEQFVEHARLEVAVRGGQLPGLALVPESRREITPEAWPLLVERFGPAVAEMVKVPIGKVEDALRDAEPTGQKAAAVREFMAQLDAVGGIESRTIKKLELRPVPVPLEDTMAEIASAVEEVRQLEVIHG
jgi:hypothetical protein